MQILSRRGSGLSKPFSVTLRFVKSQGQWGCDICILGTSLFLFCLYFLGIFSLYLYVVFGQIISRF